MLQEELALALAACRLVEDQVADEPSAVRREPAKANKVLARAARERPSLNDQVLMHHRDRALRVAERAAKQGEGDHLRIARPLLAYLDLGSGDDANADVH